tara:strand:+ start:1768 stop:1893 length:126 start_codon:yes stop_codon:yes gene_type:complete
LSVSFSGNFGFSWADLSQAIFDEALELKLDRYATLIQYKKY